MQTGLSRRTLIKAAVLSLLPIPFCARAFDVDESIIIYYSKTGSVATLARFISKLTGVKTLELKLTDPYAQDYSAMTDIAREERSSGARREIATKIPDLSDYRTVFIGSPYWWGGLSIPMRTFLTDHPMKGKQLIPFCVSGSSSPRGLWQDIEKLCPEAKIEKGFHTTQSAVNSAEPAVKEWLTGLDIL